MTSQALTLPEEEQLRSDFRAVARFQAIAQRELKEGHDYGVIPGTQRPTLLKAGAEKIAKLLGLADTYEILHSQEDWDKGFFRYLIRCRLVRVVDGAVVSEGLGECNSMESRYRWRWLWPNEAKKAGVNIKGAATRFVNTRNGQVTQYRVENEDIYSQVNTILKMAKKRSLVDAALSAGRLSEVFTQDIEDAGPSPEAVTEQKPSPRRRRSRQKQPKANGQGVAQETPQEPIGEALQARRARALSLQDKLEKAAAELTPERLGSLASNQVLVLGAMFTLAQKEFGLEPGEIRSLLGVESIGDIVDTPQECWEHILYKVQEAGRAVAE